MGAVFVSYRRGDSEGQARALSIQLAELIRKGSVFMDVDSIALGRDFRQILQERLESCDLMLALIGPGWMDVKDASGNRRLDSPTEMIRAVQRHAEGSARVIPVTFRHADWERAPFAKLQALPKDAMPISSWHDQSEGWNNVAKGIRTAVEVWRATRTSTRN
jgi:hypothetical protein